MNQKKENQNEHLTITINKELKNKFLTQTKLKGFNKSALIRTFIKDWLIKNPK